MLFKKDKASLNFWLRDLEFVFTLFSQCEFHYYLDFRAYFELAFWN